MRVRDIMTSPVTTVTPDTPVREALRVMLDRRISGLPVVDDVGMLVGLVSEGDFLRRSELGTEKKRSWLDFLRGHGRAAEDYAHSHGRTVGEVMSREVVAISHNAPLEEAVALMEKRRVRPLAGDRWRRAWDRDAVRYSAGAAAEGRNALRGR
jgi:CBS domain-containing protein